MTENSLKIAIVGMAGRFPGAENLDAFWENLQAGISGGKMLADADDGLVHYGFALENKDMFDGDFFDVPAREARMLDPQHRIFLECAYAALEHAGMAPRANRQLVGVFGSCNFNGYALRFADRILDAKPLDLVDMLAASDKDYLAARVAYKLNLKGPAMTVQSACSSSLAAAAMACQALLAGQCDVALAGGAGLKAGVSPGYSYEPEGPLSCDGHVRAYSDDASGVNEGEGVGVVVLKRLDDALRDRDIIYAVISGYAIGNDGSDKTGFYAPSVSGQAAVIADALAMSGVDPLEIGLVEGHGTGTPIGDPMEVAALTQAWAIPQSSPRQYCRLGSVKTGIGHLNAAAGVASLIKTALALHHKVIPASLDFHAPNPRLALESTPFRIAGKTESWTVAAGKTRVAAVNSLGIGGNNVHLILEEGPEPTATDAPGATLITLSAKTTAALEKKVVELSSWGQAHPVPLADLAHTLLLGRDMQACRLSLVCQDSASLLRTLQSSALLRRANRLEDPDKARPVAFLFPGFGSQYSGMARELCALHQEFGNVFNRICALFQHETGIDVAASLDRQEVSTDTRLGTFALFAVEYALAMLLQDFGIQPSFVMGHSAGEYVAATVAGVFSENDAVRLIAERSRLIDESPSGAMLFVPMASEKLQLLLPEGVNIATVITPNGCVASGTAHGINALEAALNAADLPFSKLAAEKAGHSSLLHFAMPLLRKAFEGVELHRPQLPILSNVTGSWLTEAEATDAEYWVSQLCAPVQLSDQISTLCHEGEAVLLEVGPSRKLSAMLRRHPAFKKHSPIIPVMPSEQGKTGEHMALLEAIGQLWQQGGRADWAKIDALSGGGHAVPLPTYPFERQRYWLERQMAGGKTPTDQGMEISVLCWRQIPVTMPVMPQGVIGFLGKDGADVAEALRQRGWNTLLFKTLADLQGSRALPDTLVDCRFAGQGSNSLASAARTCGEAAELCAWLAECANGQAMSVYWLTSGAAAFGTALPIIDRSALLAPARVLPFESRNTLACLLDVEEGLSAPVLADLLEKAVSNRMAATALTSLVAVRAGIFWQEQPECVQQSENIKEHIHLREGAAYLVFGGSGGIGRTFMLDLARQAAEQQRRIRLVPLQKTRRSTEFWENCASEWAIVRPRYVDLNNQDELMQVLDEVLAEHKDVAGIVHASGVTGGGLMQAQSLSVEKTENWSAKVIPLLGIEKVLQFCNVDFVIFNTSIGALCGSVGQLDNTVANIVLDTWAMRQQRAGTRVMGIRWDVWRQVGMINKMASLHARLSGEELKGGIAPDAALAAVKACFGMVVELPVVSGRSLAAMLEEARTKRGLATDALESADLKAEGTIGQRPPLMVEWRGARHTLDRALVDLFESRLGLSGIGIDDDYVELGGDSLMAMPLAKEIRDLFDLSAFSVAQIFRQRTVANIADYLTESQEEKERLFALAELLESVKHMRPEDVSASLEALS